MLLLCFVEKTSNAAIQQNEIELISPGYFTSHQIINIKLIGSDWPPLVDKYRIKVISNAGSLKTFNSDTSNWVGSNQLWIYQSPMQKELSISTDSILSPFLDLEFEIQDVYSGEIYKSSKFTLLSEEFAMEYISKLNANIMKDSGDKNADTQEFYEPETELFDETSEVTQSSR